MKKITTKILVGIPGSGKTTWANEFLKANSGWVRVSRDYYRFMLRNEDLCQPKIEELITELVNTTIVKALVKNQNVIVDATHVKLSYINEIVRLVREYSDVEFEIFDVSKEVCIERDSKRDRKVGIEVINKMYESFEILKKEFNFENIYKVKRGEQNVIEHIPGLPNAVMCDLDGTLCLLNGRNPYDASTCENDLLNIPVYNLLKGKLVLFTSGREDKYREQTLKFMTKHNIVFEKLFMRKTGDMRKDDVIKKEIFEEYIRGKYNITAVFDDRLSVCRMHYSLGLPLFRVGNPDSIF